MYLDVPLGIDFLGESFCNSLKGCTSVKRVRARNRDV